MVVSQFPLVLVGAAGRVGHGVGKVCVREQERGQILPLTLYSLHKSVFRAAALSLASQFARNSGKMQAGHWF